MITASELVDMINNSDIEDARDQWNDCMYDEIYQNYSLIEHLKSQGVTLETVDSYGGEGQGDDYWRVFSATKDGETTYFKLDGWYASFHGAEFNDIYGFVEVKQVPVESYEWEEV